jgi:hypothetical protein
MRQNLNDGTDELFGVIKNFQNTFKEKRDRLISADPKNRSQQIEMDLLAYTEQFGDFSKSMAIIDPRNFSVNVGIMEPDPENQGVMKVGKTIATASFLKKIQDTKVDYFDADAAADKMAKAFGTYERAVIDKVVGLEGRVTTINDVTENPEFEKMFDEAFKSISSNPFNITSILTEDIIQDDKGNPYVSSISGKQGNVIKLAFNPTTNYYEPEFTPEQINAAKKRFRTLIEMRLDSSIKESPYNRPQPNVGRGEAEPTPSGGNYAESVNKFKTKLKAVPPKRDKYVFTGTEDITVENLENLFSSDPALIGKFKVSSADNVVTVTDNDDVLIGSYDLSKTDARNKGTDFFKQRETYLDDLINKVTNYSISKDPTIIGVSLMTGQESGGGTSR